MLETINDNDLIKMVKEDSDSDALKELAHRHSGLYHNILNQYSYIPEIEKQDIIDHKEYNIYQFALDYKPEKGMKFSSFVGQQLKWQCKSLISREISFESMDARDFAAETEQYDDPVVMRDEVNKIADEKFREIFNYRFSGDKLMPWRKISELMNINHETLRSIYNKNIEIIKHRIENKL